MLLATVGMSDPGTVEQPTGPVRAARQVRPDDVTLVHTAATAARAADTTNAIQRDVPGVTIELFALHGDDPTDVESMLRSLHRQWRRVRRGTALAGRGLASSGELDVHICATSGTPQMGLALTISADLAFPWARHWTALRPTLALQPANSPGDGLLRPFRAGLLRHEQATVAGLRLLAGCRFHEAAARLEERVQQAGHGHGGDGIGAVLAAWRISMALRDLADHDLRGALAHMLPHEDGRPLVSVSLAAHGAPPPLVGDMERMEAWYRPLAVAVARRQPLPSPWPAELVAAARREWAAGRPALAATRLQTAFEVTVHARLRQVAGDGRDRDTAGWEALLNALRQLDPALDRFLAVPTRHLEEPVRLARTRNALLHRARAERAADLDDLLGRATRFVDGLLRRFGWPSSTEAPATPERLRDLAAHLAEWAGTPIWTGGYTM